MTIPRADLIAVHEGLEEYRKHDEFLEWLSGFCGDRLSLLNEELALMIAKKAKGIWEK